MPLPKSARNSRRLMGLPQSQGSRSKYSRSLVPGRAWQQKRAVHVRVGSSASEAVQATPRHLSALPPKANIRDLSRHVGFVPKAVIRHFQRGGNGLIGKFGAI